MVVDFSAYAGQTLILYNDSPAPVPAGAAPYDYYTGGGEPDGWRRRTQHAARIRSQYPNRHADPGDATFNDADDRRDPCEPRGGFHTQKAAKRGVFELSQEPIIIPQAAYNSAYNNKFPHRLLHNISRSPIRKRHSIP